MGHMNDTIREAGREVLLAAMILAALGTGGCAKKVGGQVVAVVNNEEITQQEVRAEADPAQLPPGQDFQAVAPRLLQRVIERNLLADYAREQGLDRGPEYVTRRRQLEQTLLATLALRKLGGTQAAPTAAEVRQFIDTHPTIFAKRERLTLDQVRFPTPANRADIQALVKLGSIDAIDAKLRAMGIKVDRGHPVMDSATVDPNIARQIVALKTGELFDLTTGGTTFISTITARTPAATPPETWTAPATEAARRDRISKSVVDAVAKLRQRAKIDYDPAYKPQSPAAPAAG